MAYTDNHKSGFVAKYGNYLAIACLAFAIDTAVRDKCSYSFGNIGLAFVFLYLSSTSTWIYEKAIPKPKHHIAKKAFIYTAALLMVLSLAAMFYETKL